MKVKEHSTASPKCLKNCKLKIFLKNELHMRQIIANYSPLTELKSSKGISDGDLALKKE
jgi:hypothetical protein